MIHNRRLLAALAGVVILMSPLLSPSGMAATLFPYPVVPDTVSTLTGRANYFVEHFWDRADMKRVFSNRQALRNTMSDYLALMPHAEAPVSLQSISSLLDKLKKQPRDLEFIAVTARDMLYGDSAAFWSDELFLPFARAVADNKKADAGERARMQRLTEVLSATRQGLPAPVINITKVDGTPTPIYIPDDSVTYQVLFFNDPSCQDCDMARIRLNADYLTSRLVKAGLIRIINIYPGEADEYFKNDVALRNPDGWTLGANENVDLTYDIRTRPCFYLLTGKGYIVEKNIGIDDLLPIIYRLRKLKAAQAVSDTSDEKSADNNP